MNLILTFNGGGDWIPPNVEASHKAAAARWGCAYLQIIDVPEGQQFRVKHEVAAAIAGFDRVLMIDGDAIIAESCPDIFEHVPPSHIGGVANATVDPPLQHSVQEMYWRGLRTGEIRAAMNGEAQTRPEYVIDTYDYIEDYINGGVVVFTPSLHVNVFRLTYSWMLPFVIAEACVEQTLFNMAIHHTETPLTLLPREFNWTGPDVWESDSIVGHISHFAQWGPNYRDATRRPRMERMEWRNVEVPA